MNTGTFIHVTTLDTPVDEGTYQPLDPPRWWVAAQSEGPGLEQFTGRFHPGINQTTRIHFRGRVYHVARLENLNARDRTLVVHGSEVLD